MMSPPSPLDVIALWPDTIPDRASSEQTTVLPGSNRALVRNVTVPTLTAYLPDPPLANGTAVIVCPGGGFQFYPVIEHEGTEETRWLNARGVAAFVLHYRLISTGRDADFLQLIRLLFAPPALLEQTLDKEQVAEQRQQMWQQQKLARPLAVLDGEAKPSVSFASVRPPGGSLRTALGSSAPLAGGVGAPSHGPRGRGVLSP